VLAFLLPASVALFSVTFGRGIAAAQPGGLVISSATCSGSDLVLSGSGGLGGAVYFVLTSTNITLTPKSLWTRISTNVFDANGGFSNTIPLDPASLGSFFRIAQGLTFPGLVAAYSFDEGTGTIAADSSGNGNTGTVVNATWTSGGMFGSALVFNGTSSRVTIADSPLLHLTTGMTLEAWVNPSIVSSAWRDVIYKANDNYFIEGTSANFGVPAVGGKFTTGPLYGGTVLSAGAWAHLAATYDGTTLRLYENGAEVASRSQTGSIMTSTNPLQIGGDILYGQFFQGIIDEVRVYTIALSPAQIQWDMNTPIGNVPTTPGNLVATPVSGGEIDLSWSPSTADSGVTGYLVERQGPGDASFVQIGIATGTSFNDTGLAANTNYSYRVRATDGAGHRSAYSNIAQAYTGFLLTPRLVVLTVTQTQQFTNSLGNTRVVWSVDGVLGGTAASGAITTSGLYTPPANAGTHTVTAVTPDQSLSLSSTVYVATCPGVFTYHNDNFRTGQNLNETVLTPANVNYANFGKLFAFPLDGLSFASPLYVANLNIPGQGYHNAVYVATEHDSVYAFDADGLSATPLWHVSFIDPGAGVTTVPAGDTGETGDIPNEIGITSTPVIDPGTGTLYVVAKTKEGSGGNTTYVQRLHALDLTSGADKLPPAVIQATVAGTGSGSAGGQLPFSVLHQNQRTALLLANGVVYFGFSSHGDQPPFHGWVMGYNAATLQQVMVFCDTPNGDHGGIWMDGDGLAVDAQGSLYCISGDGTFDANTGGKDYADSFLKLITSGAVSDYFTPHVQNSLQAGNLDLGAGGVLLLPDQAGAHPHEMISAGKNGSIYLVNRDAMGHYNATSDTDVQSVQNIFTKVTGIEGGNFGSPVYFNGYVYFSPVSDNVQAFQLSNGLITTSPTSHSAETYDIRGGTLAISADGNGNGILWALQSNDVTGPGVLHAYDASNLANELYTSDQAGSRDTLDAWWKFTAPVVANGKVFVTSVSQLTVYGLLPVALTTERSAQRASNSASYWCLLGSI
jgi:hypothetical protein